MNAGMVGRNIFSKLPTLHSNREKFSLDSAMKMRNVYFTLEFYACLILVKLFSGFRVILFLIRLREKYSHCSIR